MAEILELKARSRPYRNPEPIPAEGARILFFLGVRYERMDTVEKPTRPAGGGKSASARGRRRRA